MIIREATPTFGTSAQRVLSGSRRGKAEPCSLLLRCSARKSRRAQRRAICNLSAALILAFGSSGIRLAAERRRPNAAR